MSRTIAIINTILIACLALACLGGLVWANTVYVRQQPVEKNFLVPWLGARTFIQYGDSPYSDPATQRAQILYYGRLASQGQDPLALWLPFPFELFYFPFALIGNYALARAAWMVCLEIALVALAFLSLRLTGWKPNRIFLPIILLFPLVWVFGVIAWTGASADGFIALAVAGFLLALEGEQEELAGALLVVMAGAARVTGILVLFMLWWVIYQRRWRMVWGALMTLAVMLGLAFLFLPDWFLPFLHGLLVHFTASPGISSVGILASWSPVVGLRLGWLLAAVLLLLLFLEWGKTLKKDFRSLFWTACLTLSITPLLGIPMVPGEYLALFLPLLLFLSILAERRPWIKQSTVAETMLVALLLGSWALIIGLVKANAYRPLINGLMLLLPVLLVPGLYWMRWWYLHTAPTRLEPPP